MHIPREFEIFKDKLLDEYKNPPIMNTDIIENEYEYELQIELPGIKKEDIKIELNKGLLSISANIISLQSEENKKYLKKERFAGEVKRSFNISENINEDDIHASLENGVLYLTIPKKEESNNKKIIEIN
jgi:HSP20 family molecular chaperone IbpA